MQLEAAIIILIICIEDPVPLEDPPTQKDEVTDKPIIMNRTPNPQALKLQRNSFEKVPISPPLVMMECITKRI